MHICSCKAAGRKVTAMHGCLPCTDQPPILGLKGLPASKAATLAPLLAQTGRAEPQPQPSTRQQGSSCVSPRETPLQLCCPWQALRDKAGDDHFMLSSRQHKACLPIPGFFPPLIFYFHVPVHTQLLPEKPSADHCQMVHTEVSVVFCFFKDPR